MPYLVEDTLHDDTARGYGAGITGTSGAPAFVQRTAVLPAAVINIRDLRLRTFIGFNPDERTKKQDVVVNIEIAYIPSRGVLDDRVESALDYKRITKKVISHVESGKFLLLEKLVADVLAICSDHTDVRHCRVTIDKPHALRFSESVSLTMECHANGRSQAGETCS